MLLPLVLISGLALLPSVAAQTYTDCNPTTNSSCPSDTGLYKSTYSVDFTSGSDDEHWTFNDSGDLNYTSSGVEFTIGEEGDAPTIVSNWYIFFGSLEIVMKSAPGTGIVSCAVLLSDDLDEIDWEWLGGSSTEVQTDYFGKGNSTGDRGITVSDLTDTQTTSHNYTVTWTAEEINWLIDGSVVRTLTYDDALNGSNYPQTPMRVKLGIWAGGDPDNSEGTIEWAGGETDYDDAPFTMVVESIRVTNANPASSYTYGDETGDYDSIKLDSSSRGNSSSSSASSTSVSGSASTETTTGTSGIPQSGSNSTTSTNPSTTSNSSSSTAAVVVASGVRSVIAALLLASVMVFSLS